MSVRLIKSTGLKSISNFIKIDTELCELIGEEVCVFSHPCGLA